MKSTRTAPSKKDSLKIAGYLTDSDREILNNHAKKLLMEDNNRSKRELKKMQEMYNQYGWSIPVKGV
jgi:hypothetical protein